MIEALNTFDGFLWGWFLIIILLGTGLILTVRYRAVQFRHFGEIFANIRKSMNKGGGNVSGFGALCSALGSQVGTGNLVGVATALVSGGVVGHTMREALRYGVARGLFSNDAGNGTAAALHSAAEVKHPVTQGLSGMLGVFVDTVVVCSCTAMIILSTGALESGKTGIQLTQEALSSVMGKPGAFIIVIAMFLFGFTSLLADIQIGEVNLGWTCNRNKTLLFAFRVLGCFLAFLGAIIPTDLLWIFVDILTAFMVLVNVGPLIALSGKVAKVIDDYEAQKKNNIEDPVWDFDQEM